MRDDELRKEFREERNKVRERLTKIEKLLNIQIKGWSDMAQSVISQSYEPEIDMDKINQLESKLQGLLKYLDLETVYKPDKKISKHFEVVKDKGETIDVGNWQFDQYGNWVYIPARKLKGGRKKVSKKTKKKRSKK